MGEITCCNVLSDLYAMGVYKCDHILMLLGVCTELSEKEKEISTRLLIKGFNDKATEGNTIITGGQTVYNPFPIIGGVANSVVSPDEIIMPNNLKDGDVLILTKPLGTRIAVNMHQWYRQNGEKMEKLAKYLSEDEIIESYSVCCQSMSMLNLKGAKLMHKYHAHGATDVTGFGILGHLNNLAMAQKEELEMTIDTMPVIRNMHKIQDKIVKYDLLSGRCAETSGGLLIGMNDTDAKGFMEEYSKYSPCWQVGTVKRGKREAKMAKEVKIIDI